MDLLLLSWFLDGRLHGKDQFTRLLARKVKNGVSNDLLDMSIGLLTDSATDIPVELEKNYGIEVVPAFIRFGRQIYLDRIEMTTKDFYKRLILSPYHPQTYPATPLMMYEAFERLAETHDEILAIFMSSQLSNFYNVAESVVKLFNDAPVTLYDTYTLTGGASLFISYAAELIQEGYTTRQIVSRMNRMRSKQTLFAQLNTLEYLKRGGRMSASKYLVGTLTGVKPLLQVKDGIVQEYKRTFKMEKGIDIMIQDLKTIYEDHPIMISIGHIYNKSLAEKLLQRAQDELNVSRILLTQIGPAVATHVGPGSYMIATVPFFEY